MKHLWLCWIFLCMLINEFADGFKAGAPAFSCKTMTPGHGVGPQSTTAPYSITPLSPQTINGRVRVQITASSSFFIGFLLEARSSSSDDAIGSFVGIPDDAIFINCGSNKQSGVTHKDDRRRKSVEVEWEAPAGFQGSVIFMGTVVYNYTVFWVHIESLPVAVVGKSDGGGSITEEAKQLKAVETSLYSGCGVTKNCVTFPNGCLSTESCTAAVAISAIDGSYQFEMFAKRSKYVAAGLSDDKLMGGDSVFECVPETNGIRAYRSWNVPNRKQNNRLIGEQSGISLINGLYLDGDVYCKIRVDPIFFIENIKFNLNSNEYYVLLAAGSELHEAGVGYHDVVFTASADKRQLSDIRPVQNHDSFYDGCNIVKNCFGFPSGCVSKQNCKAVTSVLVEGHKYLFEMQAKDAAYVATGLSDDAIMGGDNVIECIHDDTEGSIVKAYRSWNIPNDKKNVRLGVHGIDLVNSKFVDNKLYCKVYHDEIVATENRTFDLSKDSYYLLLASGSAVEPTSVGFHDLVYTASAQSRPLHDVKSSYENTNVFYDGCGSVKSCFGYPSGCTTMKNCRAVVSVRPAENSFIFELEANDVAYVAVGISEDSQMGADSVVECVRDENNRIRAYLSYNVPNAKNNTRVRSQSVINLENGTFIDGTIYCSVRHDPVYTVFDQSFDLMKQEYILLLAAGSSVRPNNVGYHDILFSPSAEKRSLSDVAEFSSASKLLLHLHGSFMVVAWIGTGSLGIILARYYKQTWVSSSLCGKDIWFAWHRFYMVLTWILTLSAAVIMYVDVGGFVTGGPGQTHALLGGITTVLAFIQPIGATFRPHPDSSRRPFFNWSHWFIGNAAHIVAIVTIFLAVDLSKAQLPKWTDWLLAAYVIVYVITHLILSISGCMSEKSGGTRINSFPMKDINSPRNQQNQQYERRMDAAYSGFRKFILFVYFLAVAGFSTVLVLLIVYAPVMM